MNDSLALVKAAENIALADQINETYALAYAAASEAQALGRKAIDLGVKCGQLLISAQTTAKQKGGPGWPKWCDQNLRFSRQYADRLIDLTEFCNRGCSLEDASSLRQAFVLAGILPEAHRERGSQSVVGSSATWISFLTKGTEYIEKLIQKTPDVRQWPETTRDIMKEKLRPWVELYAKL